MESFDPLHAFGPAVAARYDDQLRGDEDVASEFLAGLATDGRALEFAIGTGRIAMPLAQRGVTVDGIEPGKPDYVHTEFVEQAAVGFDVARYDPVTQLLSENHVRITSEGVRFNPIVCRLITPGEMDLMARIAGLRLVNRYGSWRREPFSSESTSHVSVYACA